MPGLQVGRGIASMLVLLYHAFTAEHAYGIIATFIENIGRRGVDFFFVLSGFIIYFVHWNDIDKPSTLNRFVLKRTLRIYPPYWVLICFYLLVYAVFLNDGNHDQLKLINIVKGIALYPIEGKPYNIPTAWTLSHELLFYALFATSILNRKLGTIVLTLWGALIAANLFFYPLEFPVSFLLNPRNLEFFMGIGVANLVRRGMIRDSYVIFLLGICAWFSIAIIECSTVDFNSGPLVLLYGGASALVIYSIASIDYSGRFTRYPQIAFVIGNASYSIYIVHFPVVLVLSKVLEKYFHPASFWGIAAAIFVIIVAATSAGVAFYFVIEKPLLRKTTNLFAKTVRRQPIPEAREAS
jgi:exopolysaccharide production protein ExoZ